MYSRQATDGSARSCSPRTDVRFLEGRITVEQARSLVADLPYSRYPVIGETRDDVLGLIHLRDLLRLREGTEPEVARTGGPATVADVVRPILLLPGTNRVLPSLSRMRREGQHIAVVADEYGGTDGIVTREDLVEELVGEIYDEYDQGDEPEDTVRMSGGAVDVDGGLILQELDQLAHVGLPEGDYETVGGFMLERLGRIPAVGDTVEIPGYDLRVISMHGLRIGRVRVTPR